MKLRNKVFAFAASSLITLTTVADDTELYVSGGSARSENRPKVLIIFDTSGSMSTNQTAKEFYPRNDNIASGTELYYSVDESVVPTASSLQKFSNAINACATSQKYLDDYGVFTGYLREYRFTGQAGAWEELPTGNGGNIQIIDCYEDVDDKNADNLAFADGFPVDGEGSPTNIVRYAPITGSSTSTDIDNAVERSMLTNFGIGKPITIYTRNYVDWYHKNPATERNYTRMQIAKRVIEDVIVTTPAVDFGIAVFNGNYRNSGFDGGRIVKGIERNDENTRSVLLSVIPALDDGGWTPLCETLYEAYRYFSGGQVLYGNKNTSSGIPILQPEKDSSIESGNEYISPLLESGCGSGAFVIYITDGSPSADHEADQLVIDLTGATESDRELLGSNGGYSYLAALAGWMSRNDVNTNIEGEQTVKTFTIGFSSGASRASSLLRATAEKGQGQYFHADDNVELQSALKETVDEILQTSASFTSPSIATNNFDRTRTLDAVYYAMFLPNKGPRWSGNLKKFRVTSSGSVVDQNDADALADDTSILTSACSIWTASGECNDGNDVNKGGAASMVRSLGASRTLYGNFGTSTSLVPFTRANASTKAGGDGDLALHMGVAESELADLFSWAKGVDVDDDDGDSSTSDYRTDILGDPLHSRPLAINYSTSATTQDIRILMGTNHGFMHMFKDSGTSVTESWAFMPYELLSNVAELKANVPSNVHSVYGLDSPPVAYVERTGASISKAWAFFGMRRGGGSYYALDITNPDQPSFMWKKDSSDWGEELGQTWSEPVLTKIPGHTGPVLIVGAGYAPATKDSAGIGVADSKGRGVFIVNAENGSLIHHFGRGTATSVTTISGLEDSIPNSVATLDSDGDGLTDRLYASDTGGNVWRMDLPSADKSTWSAFKFADLGGDLLSSDRRFFAEPVVAKTVIQNMTTVTDTDGNAQHTYQNIPYDAVVIGSGNRPTPKGTSRTDMFFTLQDRNINTQTFSGSNVPTALAIGDLYDISAGSPNTNTARNAFSAKKGWYYRFSNAGEKTLAAASIINGRVFFPSYVPGATSSSGNQCLIAGEGRIYALDLHFGHRNFRWLACDGDCSSDPNQNNQPYTVVQGIPDTPQVIVPPVGSDGTDDGGRYIVGFDKNVGTIKKMKSYYYYVEE